MTRADVQALVDRGHAEWVDDDTAKIRPGPPLRNTKGKVIVKSTGSVVHFPREMDDEVLQAYGDPANSMPGEEFEAYLTALSSEPSA